MRASFPRLTNDLRLTVGSSSTTLTPTGGLRLAELLARKSFQAAMRQEAARPQPAAKARRPSNNAH